MSTTALRYSCAERVYAGSALEPAEYCDHEVVEEGALCEAHGGDSLEDAQDRAYSAWKDGEP